jgi:hypothetical protein
MEYVELLRVRAALVGYAVALAFVFVVATLILHGHGGIKINVSFDKGGVAVDELLVLGGFGAAFLATFFAANLSSERATLPLLWTKPVSRTALAYRFVAIDTLGMAVAIVMTAVAALALIAGIGQLRAVHVGSAGFANAALALGAPLAWYGLMLLVASRSDRDGASRAGALSWPVFIVIILLAASALPPPAHALAVALGHVDPLFYLLGAERPGSGLLNAHAGIRGAACWLIASVTIAIAIRFWTAREA